MSAEAALSWCERIAAIGVVIFSLEWISLRGELASNRFFSWDVLGLRNAWYIRRSTWSVLGSERLWWLQVIRAVSALALVLDIGQPAARLSCVIVLAVVGMVWRMRVPVGHDGSDQMSLLILIVAALSRAVGTPRALASGVLFIAAQGILSYAAAGWAKVFQPGWRDGSHIRRILTTSSYGMHRIANTALTHSVVARIGTVGVLLFECLFPIVLFVPEPLMWAVLAAGVAFHLACGALMGLNTFVWSFSATYPAVLFARSVLRGWVT